MIAGAPSIAVSPTPAPPRTECGRSLAAYAGAVIACIVILTCVYELWRADVTIPFKYTGDAVFTLTMAKGAVENGWYLSNPSLGAPASLDMRDFPLTEGLHLLLIKLIAWATRNYAAAINIYFLFGFPLTTITTLFVLRRFNVAYLPAIAASLLYAFQPYHYFRSEGHLALASYFFVPCQVMVVLWIYLDRLPFFSGDRPAADPERKSQLLRMGGSILVCLAQASAGVYYAFFTCYLFVVAGAAAALERKRLYPLYAAVLLIGVTVAGLLANIGNSFFFTRANGPNEEGVARRHALEAEIYGMKIAQLLLPVPGHRIGFLARKRSAYDAHSVSSNENTFAALGAAGAAGFCVLIALLLARQSRAIESRLLHGLSLLNVFAVLLATMGGFGLIFNSLVSPQIRAYNRFSIFIAFFGLFALAVLFQKLGDRFVRSKARGALFALLMASLLVLGLLDQTPKNALCDYARVQQRWQTDRDLVARIEATLPPQAMICQMPCVPFPENPPVDRMADYDHFRGYLHSKQLRWSYGAMRGRPAASRAKELSLKPIDEQVRELAFLGFSGIWVDRFGYEDNGANVERRLGDLLQVTPLVSSDQRMAFFNMAGYVERLRSGFSADEWAMQQQQAITR